MKRIAGSRNIVSPADSNNNNSYSRTSGGDQSLPFNDSLLGLTCANKRASKAKRKTVCEIKQEKI